MSGKTLAAEATSGLVELPLPIRVVSDWHLGHPGSAIRSIKQVAHELAGIGTLVMAGDGREALYRSWRQEGDSLWRDLEKVCELQGIKLVALTGNHDPDASGEGWLKLDGGRIFITHGDVVYDTASPWSRHLCEHREAVTDYLMANPPDTLLQRWQNAISVGRMLRPSQSESRHLFHFVKRSLWPPSRLWEIGKAWTGFISESGRFLEQYVPEAEVMICGHFHRGGQFLTGGRRILNTGSQMKFCRGYAVDFDGEELVFRRVRIRKCGE